MRSTFEAPYVGPSSSSSKGSQATKAYASSSACGSGGRRGGEAVGRRWGGGGAGGGAGRCRAFGERPSSEALPSDMRSVAEAPSVKGDAEAAVTVPCGLTNAGLSVA